MKLGKLIIYLVILVAVVGWVYVVEIRYRPEQKKQEEAGKKIVQLEKDKIVKIGLATAKNGKVEIQKPEKDWVITEPIRTKADTFAVDNLLTTIADATAEKVIMEKDVKWADYGLDKPDFTVDVSTADKKAEILFGASNPSKTSYYVRVDGDPKLLLVADTLKISLNKSIFDIRDKSVVGIAPEDVERVALSIKGKQIELKREGTDKWMVTAPERFRVKNSVVTSDLRTITNLKAKEIIDSPSKEGDEYGLQNPQESIELSGPKRELTLLIGKAKEQKGSSTAPADRYARIKGHDPVYLLDGRTLDGVKTDPKELRDRSLLTFNPPDIERVQVDLEGKQWIASKDKDNKWSLEKPEKKEKLDSWVISGILWDIKDLEWKSITTRKPGEAACEELDHPKLVVSFLKKGDKEPLLLKAGWKDVATTAPAEKHEEPKPAAAEKQPSDKGKAPSATKDQGKVSEEKQPPAPATALAVAQPSEEEGAVFTLDGDFVTRIRQDLKRLTEEK
jgi:hypothetical protein